MHSIMCLRCFLLTIITQIQKRSNIDSVWDIIDTRLLEVLIPPDEQFLWAILIQLLSALYTIHEMGLLVQRLFHPSKIIICGSSRVRISSTGIADLFDRPRPDGHGPSKKTADISYLGQLMLKLATNLNDATTQDLFLLSSTYSPEFHYVLRRLLGYPRSGDHASFYPTFPSLDENTRETDPRLFRHLSTIYDYCDALERELQLELDNGRLFRLIVKLGFINERPEYDYNASWSETGNRYLLKLFRDYVFHQVDKSGRPVLNLSHVVDSLNKLDLGVQERILLMTRDEKSMFFIKYSELKHYLNESFSELYRMQSRSLP
ncbi:PAN2-PAN3 deadenylation complex subunit pan3-like [Schistocerca gregaria]|uniref:PAN2-PAN3 deadenylation complex subunit pan3-like n=1 Tax=Schistocerca gregaria TaxID=7010 RepID=UPI00211DCADE|nr:PAN2-PAN3 deadenylation complex subunit pan3-like [Schistocerca gregaria]XP_049852592.1 PAN2-PAN3 deadenylation complex subunit pan3-like [Schistocerca gregaria]